METKLYYIGSDFYFQSGTFMSCIYREGDNARYDWGFLERDLREGRAVTIRQATAAEKAAAYTKLAELQAERKAREEIEAARHRSSEAPK